MKIKKVKGSKKIKIEIVGYEPLDGKYLANILNKNKKLMNQTILFEIGQIYNLPITIEDNKNTFRYQIQEEVEKARNNLCNLNDELIDGVYDAFEHADDNSLEFNIKSLKRLIKKYANHKQQISS